MTKFAVALKKNFIFLCSVVYDGFDGYCKKDYSKVEVNAVEITRIKLQKMQKNVAMASFYCLVSKIWKKVFHVAIRR